MPKNMCHPRSGPNPFQCWPSSGPSHHSRDHHHHHDQQGHCARYHHHGHLLRNGLCQVCHDHGFGHPGDVSTPASTFFAGSSATFPTSSAICRKLYLTIKPSRVPAGSPIKRIQQTLKLIEENSSKFNISHFWSFLVTSSNVGKTIINHPPVITIFTGGFLTIPQSWLVQKAFVFPTSDHQYIRFSDVPSIFLI